MRHQVESFERLKQGFQSEWLMTEGYAGGFVWTLDYDDFNALCIGNSQFYPLIETLRSVLSGSVPPVSFFSE